MWNRYVKFVQKLHDQQENTEPDSVNSITLRRVWLFAHILLISTIGVFLVLYFFHGEPYDKLGQLVLAHLAAGRPGSAGYGIQAGFDPWFILYASCAQDFAVMSYIYPLLVLGYKHLTHVPVVGERIKRAHETAWQHHHRIAPYGALGVFAFVVFPLFGTGPVIGMLIGYIIGLATPITLGAAMAGVAASTAAWIWGYQWLHEYNSQLAILLLLGMFAAAILAAAILKILHVLRRRRRQTLPET